MTESIEHAVVTATFLAGNQIELTALDAMPPADPENGDAEYYRWMAISATARRIKQAWPKVDIYVTNEA